MASSGESKEPKAAKKADYSRNTWNAENAIKVITGSADMINIVNVKPDSDGKTFHAFIHKDLLCYYSPYYTAALKGGFSEAQNDTITIELPKKLMSELVSWFYSGTITSDEHTDLMKLYVFADEKMMLALRRSIMSRLVQAQAYWFRMEVKGAMSYLKRIPQNSGLFRYLVEFWACVWSQTDAALDLANMDDNKRIPRLFFYQALQRLAELVRNRNEKAGPITSSLVTACNFHEHISIDEWEETCGSQERPLESATDEPDDGYYHDHSNGMAIVGVP